MRYRRPRQPNPAGCCLLLLLAALLALGGLPALGADRSPTERIQLLERQAGALEAQRIHRELIRTGQVRPSDPPIWMALKPSRTPGTALWGVSWGFLPWGASDCDGKVCSDVECCEDRGRELCDGDNGCPAHNPDCDLEDVQATGTSCSGCCASGCDQAQFFVFCNHSIVDDTEPVGAAPSWAYHHLAPVRP